MSDRDARRITVEAIRLDPDGDWIPDEWGLVWDELEDLQAENSQLRDLLGRRDELPNVCDTCVEHADSDTDIRPRWNGKTLACPQCGVDALENDDGV